MSSKLLSHRPALCNIIRRIAVEAGELILEYYDGVRDMESTSKDDGSPVTVADQEAERLIEKRLEESVPGIPMIGEEAFAAGRRVDLKTHDYFWLVDPLDGTRAFVAGEGDFTVNIALIHKGQPILGVIYTPEKGELYAGYINEDGTMRSFRYFEESETEKDMRTRSMPAKGLTVYASSSKETMQKNQDVLDQFKIAKVVRRSSSAKISAIANGKADIYPRFGPTCEWDTAAGHAILRAAGGDITNIYGEPLTYGGDHPKLRNPDFIAASADVLQYFTFQQKSDS